VLDARGERMSKSKGNGIDPLDLIAQFGADATRFALLQQAGKNQDIRFSEERVKLAGQFCNKLWNASRFVLLNLQEEPSTPVEQPQPHLADRWIASRLARTVAAVESGFAGYDMDDAMRAIYAFLWDEFCDWYVEMAKVRLRGEEAAKNAARRTLVETLETTLRLVHPAIPFITEEIWQALRGAPWARASGVLPEHCLGEERTILRAPFPRAADCLMDTESEEAMGHFMECVRALRNLRAELGIDPGKRLRAAVFAERTSLRSAIVHLREEACALARLESLDTVETAPTAEGTWTSSPVAGGEVYLEIGAALDVARELERLAREITATEANIARSRAKLADTRFTERAPAAIVEKERAQLAAHEETLARLAARRALFTQGKA
jgi:valyl-tRNA synthetase